jgi:hypothetical protein
MRNEDGAMMPEQKIHGKRGRPKKYGSQIDRVRAFRESNDFKKLTVDVPSYAHESLKHACRMLRALGAPPDPQDRTFLLISFAEALLLPTSSALTSMLKQATDMRWVQHGNHKILSTSHDPRCAIVTATEAQGFNQHWATYLKRGDKVPLAEGKTVLPSEAEVIATLALWLLERRADWRIA